MMSKNTPISYEGKYFIILAIAEKPRTTVYAVYHKPVSFDKNIIGTIKHYENMIGIIKYYSQWRQYCFFPYTNTVYSASCLTEIFNFITDLKSTLKHKKEVKK